jgi:hypothetical protein
MEYDDAAGYQYPFDDNPECFSDGIQGAMTGNTDKDA